MVIVRKPNDGPIEFQMGSPQDEPNRSDNEILHQRRINRSFAIGAKEVTVGQFQRFWRAKFKTDFGHTEMRRCPDDRSPIIGVTWYEAAGYCNWLSRQEGLSEDQLCYVPTGDGEFANGMGLVPDYLKRTGYRLPTEAEWEYACRAGTRTIYSFGSASELIPRYARFLDNCRDENGLETTGVVGSVKPNDYGLFELHGNAFEWCQDRYRAYGRESRTLRSILGLGGGQVGDVEDNQKTVLDEESRVLRGGSFNLKALALRSAYRFAYRPDLLSFDVGFRVARTYD
jgi:hypothetical protein